MPASDQMELDCDQFHLMLKLVLILLGCQGSMEVLKQGVDRSHKFSFQQCQQNRGGWATEWEGRGLGDQQWLSQTEAAKSFPQAGSEAPKAVLM